MVRTFIFILFNLCIFTSAQNDSVNSHTVSYDEKIMLRLNIDTNTEQFVIISKESDIEPKLALNNQINTSFGIDYKFISASISFAPKFFPGNNNDLKGKSSYTSFNFRLFPKNIIQTFSYKNSKGYYIRNTRDFVSDWQNNRSPYLTFPNLRIQSFGGSTSYIFNQDFSLKGIYYQKEWQQESNGSFVPSFNYEYVKFSDNQDAVKSKENQLNLSFDAGYYYNYLITKHINIAPFVFAGVGKKWSNSKDDVSKNEIEKRNYFTQNFGGGIHLGYNSEKIFFGSKFNYSGNHYDDDGSNVFQNDVYVLFFIGYRLDPPAKVKKMYDKIQDKIPAL